MTTPMRLFACLAFLPAALPAVEKPNILILYADDMGYGDLRANHPESKIPTPHLDKLAAESMLFTDAHSSSWICTPSRYAMLTGRHHWRDFHSIVGSFGPPVFKKDRLTLPAMLKAEGYHTACIGKWHLGWDWDAIRKPGTARNSLGHVSRTLTRTACGCSDRCSERTRGKQCTSISRKRTLRPCRRRSHTACRLNDRCCG